MMNHQLTQIANEIHNSRDLSGATKQFLLNELKVPVPLIDLINHRPQQPQPPRPVAHSWNTPHQQAQHHYQSGLFGSYPKPSTLSEEAKVKWVIDIKADAYNHVGMIIHNHTTFGWLGYKELPSIVVTQYDIEMLVMQASYLSVDICQTDPNAMIGRVRRDILVDAVNTCVNIYWARALMHCDLTGVLGHQLQEIQKWVAEGDRLNGFLSYVERKVGKPNTTNQEPTPKNQVGQDTPHHQDIFRKRTKEEIEDVLVRESQSEVVSACQNVMEERLHVEAMHWQRVANFLEGEIYSSSELVDLIARYAITIFEGTPDQYTGYRKSEAIRIATTTILGILWAMSLSEEEKHALPNSQQTFVKNYLLKEKELREYFKIYARRFNLKYSETQSDFGSLSAKRSVMDDHYTYPKLFNGIKPKGPSGCIPLPEVNNERRHEAENLVRDLSDWDGDTVVQAKMNMIDKICTYILIAAPGLTLEEIAQINPKVARKYAGIGDVSVRMLDTIRLRAQEHLELDTKPRSMGGAG